MSTPTNDGTAAPPRLISVIAFTGLPGVGKATAARMLADHCAYVPIAFAEPARSEISALWDLDAHVLSHRPTLALPMPALAVGRCRDPAYIAWSHAAGLGMHEPRSPRWVVQQWSSYRRRYRPSHFAGLVAQRITHHLGMNRRCFAVSDLQDPVDARVLRGLGVKLGIVRVHSGREAASDAARSPLAADFDIRNDGTLEALRDSVLQLPQLCERCGTPHRVGR